MRLLLTRPLAESASLATRLHALGHATLIDPLITIAHRPGAAIDPRGAQGFVATSANGVRALSGATARRDLPLYAVGAGTASAARAAGFSNVAAAGGNLESLAALVAAQARPGDGRLIHAAGRDVAGDLGGLLGARGFAVERIVLYEARAAAALNPRTVAALDQGQVDGVLFFSPRTAAIFVTLARRAEMEEALNRIVAFCLSDAVAGMLPALPLRAVAVRPTEDGLIERIGQWIDPA